MIHLALTPKPTPEQISKIALLVDTTERTVYAAITRYHKEQLAKQKLINNITKPPSKAKNSSKKKKKKNPSKKNTSGKINPKHIPKSPAKKGKRKKEKMADVFLPTSNKWEQACENAHAWCDKHPRKQPPASANFTREMGERDATTGEYKFSADYFGWYNYFIQPEFHDPRPMGLIHNDWADELDSDDKLIMLKPRDHYKTTFITIGWALYNLCEELLYPVLIISLAKSNTKLTYNTIKRHLTYNKRILGFYGYLINDDEPCNSRELFLHYSPQGVNDATLFCGTFMSAGVMGTHPKLAILDDIEDKALTEAYMEIASQMINASIIPAIGNNGQLIVVGTLKGYNADNDVYLMCKDKEIFSYYVDRAVYKVTPKLDAAGAPMLDPDGETIMVPEMNLETNERIYDMPPKKHIYAERIWVQKRDPGTNAPLFYKSGRHKGKPKMKKSWSVKILKGGEFYRSIYPEAYSVEDIIVKRRELKDKRKGDGYFWSEYFLRPSDPHGKEFDKKRFASFPNDEFPTLKTFRAYVKENALTPITWIDPGGKGGHGIAMALEILDPLNDRVFICELNVVRGGVPGATKVLFKWMEKWGRIKWGVESNYGQKENFGEPMERELKRLCKIAGKEDLYSMDKGKPNTTDKILRIRGRISQLIGVEGESITVYVNKHAHDYEGFMDEVTFFPDAPGTGKNEFDLMDCVASMDIHFRAMGKAYDWFSGSEAVK